MSDLKRIPGRPGTDAVVAVPNKPDPSPPPRTPPKTAPPTPAPGVELQQTAADIEKAIAAARKETELAQAQKALLDAKRALEPVTTAPDPAKTKRDAALADAGVAKAQAEAEKALADTRKAQADAELAAFKARFGEVPSSGITGAVEMKEKAGQIESWLLASRAVAEAAIRMRAQVASVGDGEKTVFVFAAADFPTFDALLTFTARRTLLHQMLEKSLGGLPVLQEESGEAVPILGAAGLALQAVNNLLSFVRTDFSVTGVEVTIEDSALVAALTSQKIGQFRDRRVLSVFRAAALNEPSSVVAQLTELSALHERVGLTAEQHKSAAATLTARAATQSDAERKKQLTAEAETHRAAEQRLTAAAGSFTTFMTTMSTPESATTKPPLATVLYEAAVQRALTGHAAMIVKIHKAGGTIVTKKNLWSLFGGLPVHYTGGAAATYMLLDGTNGTVLASGLVPVYGGFVRADRVQDIR